MKKAKRIKFKRFKTKDEALAFIKRRRKNFPQKSGYSYFYNTMKFDKLASDKKKWLAYCLITKITGR